MSDTMSLPGGWTSFSFNITEEAMNVFKQALNGRLGVDYTPLAFATQVVAGTNYCYICKGQVIYPDAPEMAVMLYIYAPLQGPPHIIEIKTVKP